MDDQKDTYVYVITNGPECKVGIATDAQRRLDDLQIANPLRLYLAYLSSPLTREKALAAEADAHRILDDFATDGGAEWFRVAPDKAAAAVETAARVAMRHPNSIGKRGRKRSLSADMASTVAAAMTGRDDRTSVAEIAASFGISVRTAYRAVAETVPPAIPLSLPVEPRPDTERRRALKEAVRTYTTPLVDEVIENERFVMTQRAKDALAAAHAKLADGWRLLQDDRAAMEREREDFLRRVRVRIAKVEGPQVQARFGFLRGPLRYSVTSVTYGLQPKVPTSTAASAPIELPPWPLPWEPMHPTEAVGRLFRRAMRNQSLPAAAVALDLVDKAIAALNAFRGVLTEPGTGPPIAEPAPEPVPEPQPEPQQVAAEKSAIFAKMFPELVKDQPPPGFGTPTNAD